jgi:hypothetical protein
MSSDIISLRRDLSDYSEFILFTLIDIFDEKLIDKYYSSAEIKKYKKTKFNIEKISFPIEFDVCQVTNDQWIGATTYGFLMKLRDAQLIHYNENTQRTLTHKTRGGVERWVPTVNKRAVDAIRESFAEKRFIPNTITLNIQIDEEADFEYKDHKLIINKLDSFDITDGFHRYLAFGQVFDFNKDFDYPMEIRITNFGDNKANQFIYQEDQKTKMRKSDSDSHNQYNYSVQVLNRLNEDNTCNLFGEINNTNGMMHFGTAVLVLDNTYFSKKKKISKKEIIEISKEIKTGINNFTEEYDDFLNKRWTNNQIIVVLYGIYKQKTSSQIKDILELIPKGTRSYIHDGKISKKIFNIIEEVCDNE